MRVIGLDIGSRTVKRVVLEDGKLVDHDVVSNSHDPIAVCDGLVEGRHPDRTVATGYGRRLYAANREASALTEIRAAAIGARHLFPNARLVLDIGGQDTKVIALDPEGAVTKFEMNDRCAAGTGRFLEVMAVALSYTMGAFVQAGREAKRAQPVNAMCTVFAESEVISATASGVDRAELARGLHDSVVRRAAAMVRRFPLEDDIVFCGGGALNGCLHALLVETLGHPVHLPPEPQIVAALGAALSVTELSG